MWKPLTSLTRPTGPGHCRSTRGSRWLQRPRLPGLDGLVDSNKKIAQLTAELEESRAAYGTLKEAKPEATEPDLASAIATLIAWTKRRIHWMNDIPAGTTFGKAELADVIERLTTLNKHMAKVRGKAKAAKAPKPAKTPRPSGNPRAPVRSRPRYRPLRVIL
jgi:hypothetical protein